MLFIYEKFPCPFCFMTATGILEKNKPWKHHRTTSPLYVKPYFILTFKWI
jgi:hypothetical protein